MDRDSREHSLDPVERVSPSTGENDTGSALYDYQTGGCRDGLSPGGPNQNQGAESTLAWLISLLTVMDLNRVRTIEANEAVAPSIDDDPESLESSEEKNEAACEVDDEPTATVRGNKAAAAMKATMQAKTG